MIHNVLAIAGFDPSGGAGVLADVKTISACECYGLAAVTALTAQNTRGVFRVEPLSADFVAAELDAIFADIRIDAVKLGMLGSADIAATVAERLSSRRQQRVVLDPVLASTSGDKLAAPGVVEAIRLLLPLVDLVTPNLSEAAALAARPEATSDAEIEDMGCALLSLGARAVLMKGGHRPGREAIDTLITSEKRHVFTVDRIDASATHGTGCALSSAIACALACGCDLEAAVARAKAFVTGAIAQGSRLDAGDGQGPVHHFWRSF